MTHAERCPICVGTGQVAQFGTTQTIDCKACNGQGWVTVKDITDIERPIFKTKPLREIKENEQERIDGSPAESSE